MSSKTAPPVSKCHWCKKPSVTCVTRSTVVKIRPPYQGQSQMTRVVVIGACEAHRDKLVAA